MIRPARNVRGVSLIELMVALAIGSLLVLGLVEVFAASRTAYQLSEGLSRVQENGRFGMDYLMRDLRMSGHYGCVNDQSRFLEENVAGSRNGLITTFVTQADRDRDVDVDGDGVIDLRENYTNAPFELGFHAVMLGYNANGTSPGQTRTLPATPTLPSAAGQWTPALPLLSDGRNLAELAIAGSDVLVLRHFAPTGAQVTSFTAGNPAIIHTVPADLNAIVNSEGVTNPGLFGISDCATAAVFRASNVFTGTGRITVGMDTINRSALDGNNGSNQFATGQALVYRAESLIYYVGRGASGEPALFRMRFNVTPGGALAGSAQAEELVEGVESMQLLFGIDESTTLTDTPHGHMSTSEPAGAGTLWNRVGFVQVGLVTRSPDSAATQQREAATTDLSALGVNFVPPADGSYRTVYESSVALRNRLFGN